MVSAQETSKLVENFYKFIWAKLMTNARKQNLNGFRKCSRKWQFYHLYIRIKGEDVRALPIVHWWQIREAEESKAGESLRLNEKWNR